MKLSSRTTAAFLLLLAAATLSDAQRAPVAPRTTTPVAPRRPAIRWEEPLPPIEPMFIEPMHISSMFIEPMTPMTPMPPMPPMMAWSESPEPMHLLSSAPRARVRERELVNTMPRASWAPQDAADSIWRLAREAMNRTEYRVAARYFRELRDKFPRSQYAGAAAYYEAFCLYRIGTVEDLRSARTVLKQAQAERYPEESMQADAVTLAARIQGALARRGDPEAQEFIRQQARQDGGKCDAEELEVRVEALSALTQMDETSALPVLRRVLAQRDSCTAMLRRRAIYLLVRKSADSTVLPMLLEVVQNDPEIQVRQEAVQAMSRVPGARTTDVLQQILRTSKDERVQVAAVQAIAQRDDWSALRGFIERTDVPLELRVSAVQGISRERSTPEDAAWLRGLYARVMDPSLKEAVANAVGRLGGETNEQWLVALARNTNEPVRARTSAISRLSRSDVSVADFNRIYDAATERQIREMILRVLAERKEPEALDKLIDVARTGTDPVLRRTAVSLLSRFKSDPRVAKLMVELVGGAP